MAWQAASASSIDLLPAITAENSSVQRVPTSWNSGTPTNWTPGRPGRGLVPGLLIGAASIASSVFWAKAEAAALLKNAERQIELQTAQAVQQIRQETVDLSIGIASKLLQRNVSREDNERLKIGRAHV